MVHLLKQLRNSLQVRDLLSALAKDSTIDFFAEIEILEFAEKGIGIHFNKQHQIMAIFLYGPTYKDRKTYVGPLPRDLLFSDDWSKVNAKLGWPTRIGRLGWGTLEEDIGAPWERFDYTDHAIHIQYARNLGQIQLITLMAL